MKRTLIALALVAAFGAHAQTTVDSSAGSQSNAGAQSGSAAAINAQNSGNVSATGNVNASESRSASNSGASSGSQSGALGNVLEMNNYAPEVQTILQDMQSDQNVNYSGTIENKSTGHVVQDIRYSGTQTVKNVPGIAMSGPASGPCTGASGGLGLAGPGWGLGLNGSSVMADCRLRENTRVLGMAMQSIDGGANPQEKGELTVMFMEAARGLAAYNRQIIAEEVKQEKK